MAIIHKIIRKVKDIDKKNRVEFIVLFGSYLTKKYSHLSDIDIAVFYDDDRRERFKFRMNLSGNLGDKFDVQIFQDLPLHIRNDIIRQGKIIYKKDIKKVSEIYISTIREYSAFEKHLKLYYSSLKGAEIA